MTKFARRNLSLGRRPHARVLGRKMSGPLGHCKTHRPICHRARVAFRNLPVTFPCSDVVRPAVSDKPLIVFSGAARPHDACARLRVFRRKPTSDARRASRVAIWLGVHQDLASVSTSPNGLDWIQRCALSHLGSEVLSTCHHGTYTGRMAGLCTDRLSRAGCEHRSKFSCVLACVLFRSSLAVGRQSS